MSDIFISYSKPGKPLAETLAKVLGRRWTVWWDPKIPPGRRFGEVIQEELERARCVIVLWSKHAINSHYVREEAEFARLNGKLVPALAETVEPPIGFRTIEAANLVGWHGDEADGEFATLVAELQRRLAPATAPPLAAQGLRRLLDSNALAPRQQPPSNPADPAPWSGGAFGLTNDWLKLVTERPNGPGGGIPAVAPALPTSGVLFEDDFHDNRNQWSERRDHQKIILRVLHGRYEIENKVMGQTWCTWRAVKIDPARDFEIEADITAFGFTVDFATHSDTWPMFGVLWGGQDVDNFHAVLVEGARRMSVKRIAAGAWSDVIPWRPCASLGSASTTSTLALTLAIRKRAKVIEFSVDGQWFEDAEFEPFFGNNVGFYVYNRTDIWVRRLKISQR